MSLISNDLKRKTAFLAFQYHIASGRYPNNNTEKIYTMYRKHNISRFSSTYQETQTVNKIRGTLPNTINGNNKAIEIFAQFSPFLKKNRFF